MTKFIRLTGINRKLVVVNIAAIATITPDPQRGSKLLLLTNEFVSTSENVLWVAESPELVINLMLSSNRVEV